MRPDSSGSASQPDTIGGTRSDPDSVGEDGGLHMLESILQRLRSLPNASTTIEVETAGAIAEVVHEAAGKAIQNSLDDNQTPPSWIVQALMDTGAFRNRVLQVRTTRNSASESDIHDAETPRSDRKSFRLTKQDMPEDLVMRGTTTENIPRLLESFLTRVKLHSTDKVNTRNRRTQGNRVFAATLSRYHRNYA